MPADAVKNHAASREKKTEAAQVVALQAKMTADILRWGVPRLLGAGYGLFSTKATHSRWPEFIITAMVLKKYRLKSSYWFMLRSAFRGMRKHEIVAVEANAILAKLIGSKPYQLHQLAGIYRALKAEKGAAVAIAATVEIIRIVNQRRLPQKKIANKKKVPATEFSLLPRSTSKPNLKVHKKEKK